MSKNVIITIVVAVVVGVAGFFGGMRYQASKTPVRSAAALRAGAGGAGAFAGAAGRRGAAGGGFITGQIIAKDNTSITVKDQTGSTKIVLYSGSTQTMKSVSGSSTDLQVGEMVTATGQTNSDGSVTAQTIQIRPQMATSTPPSGLPGQ